MKGNKKIKKVKRYNRDKRIKVNTVGRTRKINDEITSILCNGMER